MYRLPGRNSAFFQQPGGPVQNLGSLRRFIKVVAWKLPAAQYPISGAQVNINRNGFLIGFKMNPSCIGTGINYPSACSSLATTDSIQMRRWQLSRCKTSEYHSPVMSCYCLKHALISMRCLRGTLRGAVCVQYALCAPAWHELHGSACAALNLRPRCSGAGLMFLPQPSFSSMFYLVLHCSAHSILRAAVGNTINR